VNQASELVAKLRSSPKIKPWDLERVEAIAYIAATNNSEAEQILKNATEMDGGSQQIEAGSLKDNPR